MYHVTVKASEEVPKHKSTASQVPDNELDTAAVMLIGIGLGVRLCGSVRKSIVFVVVNCSNYFDLMLQLRRCNFLSHVSRKFRPFIINKSEQLHGRFFICSRS